jgi:ribosomal protein S16
LIFLSFRDAAKRRARNPYSQSVVMDSGLPRYAPRSAIADLGIYEPPISGKPEIGCPGMTTEFAESL